MPSTRRSFVVGAAALLSGCVGGRRTAGTPAETPASTPTATITDRSTPSTAELGASASVGDLEVSLRDPTVQHSYLTLVYPDFADVVAPDGRQFLFVTVDATGPDDARPAAEDFAIRAGETIARGRNRGDGGRPYRTGRLYTPDHGEGRILFELPAPVEAVDVAFELDRGGSEAPTWTIPEGVLQRLRAPPPEFEGRDFEAPSTVRSDEPIEVSATIANVGDAAGTFRASLNQEGDALYGAAPFSFDMEPGEEREWTETITSHQRGQSDVKGTVRLRFRSAGGDADRDVVVRPEPTTSG